MSNPQDPSKSSPADRLRAHPDQRFEPLQHRFDLGVVARELAAEQSAAPRGHRQRTLYRHGRVTVALFVFEPGARLPSHSAGGVVTINVLEGRLKIGSADGEQVLAAGQLLILASGMPHDVEAQERSTMLLQVHLDEPASAKE